MKSTNQKIMGLDALKGFAIIGITLFHLFPQRVKGVYLGVCLFFVLSGFLLALSSQSKARNGTFSLRDYWKGRIRRIYPSLLLVLLMTIGFCVFFAPAVVKAIRPEFLSIVFGVNNFWQIAQNMDYFTRVLNASPFSHMWFLSILLQFYLIWPILFGLYRLGKKRKGWVFAVGTFFIVSVLLMGAMPVCYGITSDVTRCYYGTDTRIGALLLGASGGFLCEELSRRGLRVKGAVHRWIVPIFAVLTGAFLLAFFMLDGQNPWAYWFGIGFFTFAAFLLVLFCAIPGSSIGRWIDNPVLNWIGKNSLGLFLWQYPIIYLFTYLHWSKIFLAPVWEVALLVGLTMMTNKIVSSSFWKRKPSFRFAPNVAVGLILVAGAFGMIRSDSSKMSDQQELADKLEENQARLQADSNQTGKEEVSTLDPNDYTSSGNVKKVDTQGVVLVGDSVMLSASDQIMNVLPSATINAEVGRHLGQEQAPLKEILNDGNAHQTVVAGLGTNGILYDFAVEELIELIGEDRNIFFINAYCPTLEWEQSNNDYLNTLPALHPNVTIIDWYSLASQHPEWFFSDSTHPNEEGSKAYADLILSSLRTVMEKQK